MTHRKIKPPAEFAGLDFVVSVSGGKDSTALLVAMREAGLPFRAVFADTGWEAKETYAYLYYLRGALGITIDVVGVDGGMVARARHRTGFPARLQRWCTRELKLEPLRAYHDDHEKRFGTETVSVVGVRAAESAARAKMDDIEDSPAGERSWGGWIWRPLLEWTVEDVLEAHHRAGIKVNPLYQKGHDRVGCWPCIYSNKGEIRLLAEHDHERIDQIRALEAEMTLERAKRNEEKPGRYAHPNATFFQVRHPSFASDIDSVVAWSRTEHGGKKALSILAPPPEGGCMRWGMCEPPATEPEEHMSEEQETSWTEAAVVDQMMTSKPDADELAALAARGFGIAADGDMWRVVALKKKEDIRTLADADEVQAQLWSEWAQTAKVGDEIVATRTGHREAVAAMLGPRGLSVLYDPGPPERYTVGQFTKPIPDTRPPPPSDPYLAGILAKTEEAPVLRPDAVLVESAVVPEHLVQELLSQRDEYETAIGYFEQLQGDTDEQIAAIDGLLVEVKKRQKDQKERLESVTKPMNKALAALRDLFKPTQKLLDKAEDLLRYKLLEARKKSRERNLALQAEAAAAKQVGDTGTAIAASSELKPDPTFSDNISVREVWKWAVVDESLVPRDFWILDEKKIGKVVRAGVAIPGVRAYKEETLAVSTKD